MFKGPILKSDVDSRENLLKITSHANYTLHYIIVPFTIVTLRYHHLRFTIVYLCDMTQITSIMSNKT